MTKQVTAYEHSGRKKTYKIDGHNFNSCAEIAEKYSCSVTTVRTWIRNKITTCGHAVRSVIVIQEKV